MTLSGFNRRLERWIWFCFGAMAAAAAFLVLGPRRPPAAVENTSSVPEMLKGGDAPLRAAAAQRSPDCYLGVVVTREAVDVAVEMEGIVQEVRVRVGDRVARGDEIAVLDTMTLEHQLAFERANLRQTDAQRRRYALEAGRSAQEHKRRLALQGLLSKEEEEAARFSSQTAEVMLEAAAAEVEQVEARIAQLEATLQRARVRAPIDGTVAQRYLDKGARVTPGSPVVRLITSGNLLARFAVPPNETARVPVGAAVRVEIEILDLALDGVVEHLAPEIDPASQMVFAEARLPAALGSDLRIPSGAVARVSTVSLTGDLSRCLDPFDDRQEPR